VVGGIVIVLVVFGSLSPLLRGLTMVSSEAGREILVGISHRTEELE